MNDRAGQAEGCGNVMQQAVAARSGTHQQLIERIHSLARDLGQLARQGAKRQGLEPLHDQLARLAAPGAAGMHLQVAQQLVAAVLRELPHHSGDKLRLACDAITLAMVDLRAQSQIQVA